jgi:hypothetical protein
MPLLDIRPTKTLTALIKLEESTAQTLEQYAAFIGVSADEVVSKALDYVFEKDREFQKHIAEHTTAAVPSTLRVQRKPGMRTGQRMGRKTKRVNDVSAATHADTNANGKFEGSTALHTVRN